MDLLQLADKSSNGSLPSLEDGNDTYTGRAHPHPTATDNTSNVAQDKLLMLQLELKLEQERSRGREAVMRTMAKKIMKYQDKSEQGRVLLALTSIQLDEANSRHSIVEEGADFLQFASRLFFSQLIVEMQAEVYIRHQRLEIEEAPAVLASWAERDFPMLALHSASTSGPCPPSAAIPKREDAAKPETPTFRRRPVSGEGSSRVPKLSPLYVRTTNANNVVTNNESLGSLEAGDEAAEGMMLSTTPRDRFRARRRSPSVDTQHRRQSVSRLGDSQGPSTGLLHKYFVRESQHDDPDALTGGNNASSEMVDENYLDQRFDDYRQAHCPPSAPSTPKSGQFPSRLISANVAPPSGLEVNNENRDIGSEDVDNAGKWASIKGLMNTPRRTPAEAPNHTHRAQDGHGHLLVSLPPPQSALDHRQDPNAPTSDRLRQTIEFNQEQFHLEAVLEADARRRVEWEEGHGWQAVLGSHSVDGWAAECCRMAEYFEGELQAQLEEVNQHYRNLPHQQDAEREAAAAQSLRQELLTLKHKVAITQMEHNEAERRAQCVTEELLSFAMMSSRDVNDLHSSLAESEGKLASANTAHQKLVAELTQRVERLSMNFIAARSEAREEVAEAELRAQNAQEALVTAHVNHLTELEGTIAQLTAERDAAIASASRIAKLEKDMKSSEEKVAEYERTIHSLREEHKSMSNDMEVVRRNGEEALATLQNDYHIAHNLLTRLDRIAQVAEKQLQALHFSSSSNNTNTASGHDAEVEEAPSLADSSEGGCAGRSLTGVPDSAITATFSSSSTANGRLSTMPSGSLTAIGRIEGILKAIMSEYEELVRHKHRDAYMDSRGTQTISAPGAGGSDAATPDRDRPLHAPHPSTGARLVSLESQEGVEPRGSGGLGGGLGVGTAPPHNLSGSFGSPRSNHAASGVNHASLFALPSAAASSSSVTPTTFPFAITGATSIVTVCDNCGARLNPSLVGSSVATQQHVLSPSNPHVRIPSMGLSDATALWVGGAPFENSSFGQFCGASNASVQTHVAAANTAVGASHPVSPFLHPSSSTLAGAATHTLLQRQVNNLMDEEASQRMQLVFAAASILQFATTISTAPGQQDTADEAGGGDGQMSTRVSDDYIARSGRRRSSSLPMELHHRSASSNTPSTFTFEGGRQFSDSVSTQAASAGQQGAQSSLSPPQGNTPLRASTYVCQTPPPSIPNVNASVTATGKNNRHRSNTTPAQLQRGDGHSTSSPPFHFNNNINSAQRQQSTMIPLNAPLRPPYVSYGYFSGGSTGALPSSIEDLTTSTVANSSFFYVDQQTGAASRHTVDPPEHWQPFQRTDVAGSPREANITENPQFAAWFEGLRKIIHAYSEECTYAKLAPTLEEMEENFAVLSAQVTVMNGRGAGGGHSQGGTTPTITTLPPSSATTTTSTGRDSMSIDRWVEKSPSLV